MSKEQLVARTKTFALRVINVVRALPRDDRAVILGRELLRAGTSVGANYRAARRGKSTADFINKLKIAEEECDEAVYWMELLVESGIIPSSRLAPLMREGGEILSMLVAAIKTTRGRRSAALSGARTS